MARKTKSGYGVIVNSDKEVKVLDAPELGAPLVCQIPVGTKVKIVSTPNKSFYGIGVSQSVIGFIPKDNIKAV